MQTYREAIDGRDDINSPASKLYFEITFNGPQIDLCRIIAGFPVPQITKFSVAEIMKSRGFFKEK